MKFWCWWLCIPHLVKMNWCLYLIKAKNIECKGCCILFINFISFPLITLINSGEKWDNASTRSPATIKTLLLLWFITIVYMKTTENNWKQLKTIENNSSYHIKFHDKLIKSILKNFLISCFQPLHFLHGIWTMKLEKCHELNQEHHQQEHYRKLLLFILFVSGGCIEKLLLEKASAHVLSNKWW